MSSKDRRLPAAEVLEHEIGNAVLVAPVVDVQDVAVVQRRRESRLGLELPKEGGVTGQAPDEEA